VFAKKGDGLRFGLDRDREKVSELQEIGFQRAANAGVNVDHAASKTYIENVGRAREVRVRRVSFAGGIN
jgi:hypothetical protein